jgi:hypothetical protein
MIGKHTLEIGAADFIKGVSSGADINDGGFSNETDNVNLTANPGVLYAPAASVNSDTDSRLTGNIIASSPDMNVTSPTNRLLVTDDGKAYRYNGTKITAAGVALTAAKTWVAGFTDLVTFAGEAYATSKEAMTRWQNDDTIDGGADYPYAFTNQTVPHPELVYENNLYVADGNLLKVTPSAGVAPTTVLTLSADQIIIALGIDPGSGLMLISTTNALDISSTLTSINRLHWYDGNSLKSSKVAIIEDAILGFHCVGAIVFVGFSNNIGYLSGSGIQWLRRLNNVTADNTQLPYKHHMAHVANTFYVLDGKQVMAYGEVLAGRKVWYPAWSNPVNSNKPTFLADVGNKKLGMGFATTKFYTFDTASVATIDSMMLFSHKYVFPRPVFIRGIYIEYATSIANNDANRSLYYLTEAQGAGFVFMQDPSATFTALKNTSGANAYFIDVPINGMLADKVRMLQFRYNVDTVNPGLRRIVVAYDVAE